MLKIAWIQGMPIKQNFLTNSEGLIGACSMPLATTPAPAATPITARRLGCAGLPCACPRSPLLGLDGNVFGSVRT